MKKYNWKKIIGILSASALAMVLTINVFGADLDSLLSQTEGLEEYLRQLTTDMQTLSLEYDHIQAQIDETETRIASNEVLLEDTQAACDTQYDLMKKRIVYLYESGNTNYLTALLSSESLGDMLNKFEYINNIVGYDRDMMDKYTELVTTVNTLQSELIAKKAELEDLRTRAMDNMYRAAAVSDASETQILDYGVSEDEAHDVIQEYMNNNGDAIMAELEQAFAVAQAENPDYDILSDYDALMNVVMSDTDLLSYDWTTWADTAAQTDYAADTATQPATTAAEQPTTAAAAQTATAQPATQPAAAGTTDINYDDAYMIAALVSGEVGGCSYQQQKYMAYVVLNRINSNIYPDTAYDVLHQSGQFNIWDEAGNEIRTDTYFIENGPMEGAMQATQEAMSEDYSYYEDFPYMGAVTEQFYYDNPQYFTETYGEIFEGNYYFNANWW